MQRLLGILIMIFYLSCCVKAQERTDSAAVTDDGGDLVVSLVTCAPGPDVYELCGHAALRIRNEKMDSVWNYGIFDFTSPNFIYRFVKGETDYMVYGYDFVRFMPVYVRRGSKVVEQVLDLSQEEARRLRSLLQVEALPQNRVYRYNYVRDNCATRPWERVGQAALAPVSLPDTLYFPTYRSEMRRFHANYPWYQFGIDLALGSGLDYPLGRDEDIFAPPVLAAKLAGGTIGGKPLVKAVNVIYPGRGDVTLPPTSSLFTPMAVGIVMLLISLGAFFVWFCKDALWRWWIFLYFFAIGIAGCIVAFLVFVSEHEATSPNVLIFWLNPLQLLPAVGIWLRSWRPVLAVAGICNAGMALLLCVLVPAGVVSQVLNPAVWPMLLCLVPLSLILVDLALPGRLGLKKILGSKR